MKIVGWIAAGLVVSGMAFGDTPDLTGTWGEKCINVAESDIFYAYDHVFNDPFGNTDQLVTTVRLFQGEDCQQAQVFRTKVFVSKYQIGEAFGEGLTFDAAISTILLTSFTAKDVEGMNLVGHCGFKDWQVGVAKLVDDKHCLASRSELQVKTPLMTDSYHTIIGFNSEDDTKPYLLFGKFAGDEDSSSEANRPKVLDKARRFFRR